MDKWFRGAAYALALAGSVLSPAAGVAQGAAECKAMDWRCLREAARRAAKERVARAAGLAGAVSDSTGRGPTARGGGTTGTAGGDVVGGGGACRDNNTFQCASPVAVGEVMRGDIGTDNARERFYKMEVSEAGVLKLALTAMPNRAQVVTEVLTDQQRRIRYMIFERGEPGERLLQVAAPGTYYVHLRSGGTEVEPFAARLTNTPQAQPAGDCPVHDTYQCAVSAKLREPVHGAIGTDDLRHLFYRLDVAQPGTLLVQLSRMPTRAQVVLEVTDAEHERVGRLVFERGEPGSRRIPVTVPGKYFVRLWSGGSTAEPFTFAVQRAQSAP